MDDPWDSRWKGAASFDSQFDKPFDDIPEVTIVEKKDVKHRARGTTAQDYGTPWEFINVVAKRFGEISIDLAANDDGSNAKAKEWIGPSDNSLRTTWPTVAGIAWLNHPFDRAEPWAKKCAEYGRHSFVAWLHLASMGAKWMRENVFGKADVYLLTPRLTFEGETDPYPKDLCMSFFGPTATGRISVWDWKRDMVLHSWQYVNGVE